MQAKACTYTGTANFSEVAMPSETTASALSTILKYQYQASLSAATRVFISTWILNALKKVGLPEGGRRDEMIRELGLRAHQSWANLARSSDKYLANLQLLHWYRVHKRNNKVKPRRQPDTTMSQKQGRWWDRQRPCARIRDASCLALT